MNLSRGHWLKSLQPQYIFLNCNHRKYKIRYRNASIFIILNYYKHPKKNPVCITETMNVIYLFEMLNCKKEKPHEGIHLPYPCRKYTTARTIIVVYYIYRIIVILFTIRPLTVEYYFLPLNTVCRQTVPIGSRFYSFHTHRFLPGLPISSADVLKVTFFLEYYIVSSPLELLLLLLSSTSPL